MIINIKNHGEWYHGSNLKIDVLRAGSTITQDCRKRYLSASKN